MISWIRAWCGPEWGRHGGSVGVTKGERGGRLGRSNSLKGTPIRHRETVENPYGARGGM